MKTDAEKVVAAAMQPLVTNPARYYLQEWVDVINREDFLLKDWDVCKEAVLLALEVLDE